MLSLKGTLILLLLFFSSLFGSVFMLSPLLPVMLVSVPWYRWITDRVVAIWFTLPVAMLELVLGVRVVITGDGFIPGERSVIIMNHRTRLDWMYLWNCLLRYSYLRMEKICLKSSLKSIPGFGWAMQVAAFIFIERKWERDREHLQLMLDHLCDIQQPLQLLMFPEGTDLTATTKGRSDEFAESRGFPKYEYVLHPRTTGFAYIVNQLRKGSNVDAIHDVTVAYPYNIPQSERDLFNGNFPKEIHFHIKRYPAAQLPITLEGLQEWCRLRWLDKERLLRTFYQGDRSFHSLDPGQDLSPDEGEDQNPGLDQEQDWSPEQGRDLSLSQGQDLSLSRELGPITAQEEGQSLRRRWVQGWNRLLARGRVWFEGRRRVSGQYQGQDLSLSQSWRPVQPHVHIPPCKSQGRVFLIKLFSVVYWTAFVLGAMMLLWSYTLARWYFSSVVIFFILQERLFGGIEIMEMAAQRRAQRHSKTH
ncbi:lysocardiolipin acyltransferase 1 [Hypanus sabinus]|uniref:lysocardiolipin acyltransferase 1 n=1 Tax=Hypanus sabinus TaxID=79690 RepID=UPI0028C3E07B|nr:lysocardiolipin acyltransferase 1 [Hypanus sabinus]XP_059838509.1 lysocardiolipin acyltransferase 1 [Hypanus sabinus]